MFLTVHLLYFTPPPPLKVLMTHSNLQQFYNGGGRGGKIGPKLSWKLCRRDRCGPYSIWYPTVFFVCLFVLPLCGEETVPNLLCLSLQQPQWERKKKKQIRDQIITFLYIWRLASDPLSFGSIWALIRITCPFNFFIHLEIDVSFVIWAQNKPKIKMYEDWKFLEQRKPGRKAGLLLFLGTLAFCYRGCMLLVHSSVVFLFDLCPGHL